MPNPSLYDMFARVVSYPVEEYKETVRALRDDIRELHPESARASLPASKRPDEHLNLFMSSIQSLTLADLEELYTRTFDINAIASLEIGWHLYGEAYERGVFLVRMRELLRTHGIEESNELPDHLSHVLMALGRLETTEAGGFVSSYLNKGLEKILEGFKDKENPYEQVLLALKCFIEQPHIQGVNADA